MIRPMLAVLLLSLTACASVPAPLQGQFAAITPQQAARERMIGEPVRWGGRIVAVDTFAKHSCFKVLGLRLDARGRPQPHDQSDGRFLACRAGFYDPELFKPGREVSITGRIEGVQIGRIGELDYPYPRVAADVIYLWPEQRQVDVIIERSPFWW